MSNNQKSEYSDRSFARVHDRVYIGSHQAVKNQRFLDEHNIGFIVKCDAESQHVHPEIPTMRIPSLHDEDYATFLESEDPELIYEFIEKTVAVVKKIEPAAKAIHERVSRGENVFVHCWAGINRSALTIAWYLKKYRGMPYEDIVATLTRANATRNLPVLFNRTYLHIVKNL